MKISTRLLAVSSLSLLFAAAACSSGTSADGGGGAPGEAGASSTGGSGSTDSELVTKLSMCPELSVSSDPEASECLVGTYEGKTIGGDDCSLTIGSDGAYEFSSPKISHDRVPLDKTIFVYDFTKVQETNLLTWKVNDPLTTETVYEMSFEAKFGSQIAEKDRKIQIDVKEYGETTTSVSCTIEL